MDDEDYRLLLNLVIEQLHDSGLSDIADQRHYTRADYETGEAKLHKPHKRLVEMLRAFDRHIATHDRATYDAALRTIADHLSGSAPSGAVMLLPNDDEPIEVDLSISPDLRHIRADLGLLLRRLESGDLSPDYKGGD